MNHRSWCALLVVFTAGTAAAQEVDRPQPPPAVNRTYDVRSLQATRVEDPAPALGFVRDPTEPLRPAGEEDGEGWEPWTLSALVQCSVGKGTWEGDNTVALSDGSLTVRNTPRIHAAVAPLLELLRARIARPVAFELRELRASVGAAEAVLAGGPVLDGPRTARLAEADFTLVRTARLVGSSSERAHRGSTRASAYVRAGDAMHLVVLAHVARAEPPHAKRLASDARRHQFLVFDAGLLHLRPVELEPPPAFEHDRPRARRPGDADGGPQVFTDRIVQLVKVVVHPPSWDDDDCCMGPAVGELLLIANEPPVVYWTERLLRRLERARSVSILVRTRVLEPTGEPARQVLVDLAEKLGPPQRSAVGAEIAAGRVMVRADRSITAMTGHRALQRVGERRTCVDGYAEDRGVQVPTVMRVASGMSLRVRPTAVPTEDRVAVDVELCEDALEMGAERELDEGARLQRPALRQVHRRVPVVMRDGGAALVDIGDGRFLRVDAHVSRAP